MENNIMSAEELFSNIRDQISSEDVSTKNYLDLYIYSNFSIIVNGNIVDMYNECSTLVKASLEDITEDLVEILKNNIGVIISPKNGDEFDFEDVYNVYYTFVSNITDFMYDYVKENSNNSNSTDISKWIDYTINMIDDENFELIDSITNVLEINHDIMMQAVYSGISYDFNISFVIEPCLIQTYLLDRLNNIKFQTILKTLKINEEGSIDED